MTTPVPAPEPVHPGLIAHVEAWLQQHAAPELRAIGADAAKALSAVERTAALLPKVLTVLKAADPALAAELGPLLAEAETIAGDLTRL